MTPRPSGYPDYRHKKPSENTSQAKWAAKAVVMTVAGAVSHDRERRRKSKGREAQRLDAGESEGGEEEGKVVAAEVVRGKPGLTIWFGKDLRVTTESRDRNAF